MKPIEAKSKIAIEAESGFEEIPRVGILVRETEIDVCGMSDR